MTHPAPPPPPGPTGPTGPGRDLTTPEPPTPAGYTSRPYSVVGGTYGYQPTT